MATVQYDDPIFQKLFSKFNDTELSDKQDKIKKEIIGNNYDYSKIILDSRFLNTDFKKRLADSFMTSYNPVDNEGINILFRPAQRASNDFLRIAKPAAPDQAAALPSVANFAQAAVALKDAVMGTEPPAVPEKMANTLLTVSSASKPIYVLPPDPSILNFPDIVLKCLKKDGGIAPPLDAWKYLRYLLIILEIMEINLQFSIQRFAESLYFLKEVFKANPGHAVKGDSIEGGELEELKKGYQFTMRLIESYKKELKLLYEKKYKLEKLLEDAAYNQFVAGAQYQMQSQVYPAVTRHAAVAQSAYANYLQLQDDVTETENNIKIYKDIIMQLDLFYEENALSQMKAVLPEFRQDAIQKLKGQNLSHLATFYDIIIRIPTEITMNDPTATGYTTESCFNRIYCVEFDTFLKLLEKHKYDLENLECDKLE